MLKFVNQNLRREARKSSVDVRGWRLDGLRAAVRARNRRLFFLRLLHEADKFRRLLLLEDMKRRELHKECERCEKCADYRDRLDSIRTSAALDCEHRRLSNRVKKTQMEAINKFKHVRYLKNELYTAQLETIRAADKGKLCPVCMQVCLSDVKNRVTIHDTLQQRSRAA